MRVVRHRSPQKGRDSLRAHLAYLTREAVTRHLEGGRFYDASQDELNAKQVTRQWREDRHHFRIILSPENAQSLHDLKLYTREVMTRLERDLGPLQWLGVNHHNTKNPHSHVLIRGRAHDGTDLVIARDYIAHGIRERASQVATEWLGERTREQAQVALAAEVRAERYTTLDRALERFANRDEQFLAVNLKNVTLSRYALTTREMLAERLEFLRQLGLAESTPAKPGRFRSQERTWRIAPDFQTKLRELGERNDIIKHLYAALGDQAARVAAEIQCVRSGTAGSLSDVSVRGVLTAKGALDETSDERFIVVQDALGKPHYARVWVNKALDAAEIGAVVEVGRAAHRRWNLAQELTAVAKFHKDGLYTTAGHRQWLREHRSDLTPEQAERHLQSFSKQVARLARQPDSGVTRATANAVRVQGDLLEKFTARSNRWLDVRPIAVHSLKSQVTAEAYTWLDRQIIRTRLSETLSPTDVTLLLPVRDAMTRRADWLVQNGFAERDTESKDKEAVKLIFGATDRLKQLEHQKFAQQCNAQRGKGVSFLRMRDTLTGTYGGIVYLHRGSYALIETKQQLFAAPVSREPRIDLGRLVTAKVVSRGHTEWELSPGRTPGKSFGLGK